MGPPRTWQANLEGSLKNEAIVDYRVNFRLAWDIVWDCRQTQKDWRGRTHVCRGWKHTECIHVLGRELLPVNGNEVIKSLESLFFYFFWPYTHALDLPYTMPLATEGGQLLCTGCEERRVLCVSGCQGGGCLSVFEFLKDAEISLFLSTRTWGM